MEINGGMVSLGIDLEDLNRQAILIDDFDDIARRHLRPPLEQSIQEVRSDWQDLVPRVSGAYEGSITARVTSVVGIRSKAIASTSARRDGRFPYPAILESSPSTPRARRSYTWRGGAEAGSPARGSLARRFRAQAYRVVQRVVAAVEAIMRDLVVPGG